MWIQRMETMASIVKMHNKKSGVTYVYESESYWDKEKQQPRNKRKLIGKLDPETGKVVPTEKKGRRSASAEIVAEPVSAPNTEAVAVDAGQSALLKQKDDEIAALRKRVKMLESQCSCMEDIVRRIRSLTDAYSER